MTDTEIIERYFKALGWKQELQCHEGDYGEKKLYWMPPDKSYQGTELPKILTDFPAFKEHVLEVMEEEGFGYYTNYLDGEYDWYWVSEILDAIGENIKNNNILHAAVISATGYFEGKK